MQAKTILYLLANINLQLLGHLFKIDHTKDGG
jgi:hypothetical protein